MITWFLCKISYMVEKEDGGLKRVREAYLVDAVSFTEAETIMYEVIASNLHDFSISYVSKQNISDIFRYTDSETWFKAKVKYVTIDGESGREKKVTNVMYVSADDARAAYDRICEQLSSMLVPYEITDVNLTAIVDVVDRERVLNNVPSNLKPIEKNNDYEKEDLDFDENAEGAYEEIEEDEEEENI